MRIFSQEFEAQLMTLIKSVIEKVIKNHSSNDPWENLVTRNDICKKFHIKDPKTIKNWEKDGLKCYVSPYISTRTVLYDKREVAKFLGYKEW
ncbi:hypothetical protein [Lactococcus taiwanensis]|uniref:hypothetical protein n=1 Tax=Lactococcus taiwanensis TaxID=1151742 RepID=UPI003517D1CA